MRGNYTVLSKLSVGFLKMSFSNSESGTMNGVRSLAAIRDALLPKLLSSEIRVKDAEKFIEATA